jgi:hypothetical protein
MKIFRCKVCDVGHAYFSADEARGAGWRQNFEGLATDASSPEAGAWYCPRHQAELEADARAEASAGFFKAKT